MTMTEWKLGRQEDDNDDDAIMTKTMTTEWCWQQDTDENYDNEFDNGDDDRILINYYYDDDDLRIVIIILTTTAGWWRQHCRMDDDDDETRKCGIGIIITYLHRDMDIGDILFDLCSSKKGSLKCGKLNALGLKGVCKTCMVGGRLSLEAVLPLRLLALKFTKEEPLYTCQILIMPTYVYFRGVFDLP